MKRAVGVSGMLLSFGSTGALAAKANNILKDPSIKGSLALLNLWGEQPEKTNRLYTAAFKVLEAKKDATYADVAADSEVRQLCDSQSITHLGGPMLGSVSSTGVRVWIRTLRAAVVQVEVTVNGSVKRFGPVKSGPDTDMVAIVPVTGLEPATRYPYRVLVDDKPVQIPAHAAITTSPVESTSGKVRIAFGTCTHRWGLS